jgi:hypothetical protein
MDATASREPTWDHACSIQGEMFIAAGALGVRWTWRHAVRRYTAVAG